jgi:predicted DNA-binding protein
MAGTALSIKVSGSFSKRFRQFCEDNCLQIGKFTEAALEEVMEDYYFGRKAQQRLHHSPDIVHPEVVVIVDPNFRSS